MRRALVVVLGMLLFVGAVAGCGGGEAGESASSREAERVAVRWLQAMSRSAVVPACRLMDARNHVAAAGHPGWSGAQACQERWLHSDDTPLGRRPKPGAAAIFGEAHPEVLEVVLEGDEATVYVKGIGQRRPITLRRERGHWLVDEVEYPI